MPGTQSRGDETHVGAERRERHTGARAYPLDRPADGDAVIAVEGAQQRRLARAVRSVHDPELPGAHGEGQLLEDPPPIEIHARVAQPHETLGPGRAGTAHVPPRGPPAL